MQTVRVTYYRRCESPLAIALAQETVMEEHPEPVVDDPHGILTKCAGCNHLVPKTMVCLYCGHPIMYNAPGKRA